MVPIWYFKKSFESSTIQFSSIISLTFNIINTFFLVWFVKNIESAVVKIISSKADDDEIFQLKYFSNNSLSSEFSIIEVKQELLKFIGITSKMNSF